MIGYESSLLSLNASGKLAEPLELVYPLLLLDPAKQDAYSRVVTWLQRPENQRKIMERTLRRPVSVVDKLLADYADPRGNTPGRVEFERFYRGERITLVRFGGHVLGERDFTVGGPADLQAIRAFLDAPDFLRGRTTSGVHTYAIRFGEANAADLDRAAHATGGHLVDATATSLLQAFKEIRGCR